MATFDLAAIQRSQIRDLIQGTTLVTNALIERKGANVDFVTKAGFEDMP